MDARTVEGASHHTLHKELVTLGKTLRLMKKQGKYSGAPGAIMPEKFGQGYTPRKRPLTEEEYEKVLGEMPVQWKTMYEAMVALGVRKGEAERMRLEHIDFEKRQLFVDGTKTKWAKRTIPIGDEEVAILKRGVAEMPAGRKTVFGTWSNQVLGRACDRAKIERRSANDLRHYAESGIMPNGQQMPSLCGADLGSHSA